MLKGIATVENMRLGEKKEKLINEYNAIAERITNDNKVLLIIQGKIEQITEIEKELAENAEAETPAPVADTECKMER